MAFNPALLGDPIQPNVSSGGFDPSKLGAPIKMDTSTTENPNPGIIDKSLSFLGNKVINPLAGTIARGGINARPTAQLS